MVGKRSSGPMFLLLAAVSGLSACVSDALPREDDDPPTDARSDTRQDARDANVDGPRADAPDVSAPADGDPPDAGGGDAAVDPVVVDTSMDLIVVDVRDDRAPDVADASADVNLPDAVLDATPADADVRSDVNDTGPSPDVNDGGSPPDATDAGAIDVIDAGTPSDGSDGSTGPDADAGDGGSDVADAFADAGSDAGDGRDGGAVVFYTENFDTGFGGFANPVNTCGSAQWSNNPAGYLHVTEPGSTSVTRISSPIIPVPAGATNVVLRMSHRFDIEDGWDAAQLLIAINGGTATVVNAFTSGPYTSGGATNPTTCSATVQSQYPGWSGQQTSEMTSVANLTAAGGGDTVTITFRMLTDTLTGGAGWDINWVTLSATIP